MEGFNALPRSSNPHESPTCGFTTPRYQKGNIPVSSLFPMTVALAPRARKDNSLADTDDPTNEQAALSWAKKFCLRASLPTVFLHEQRQNPGISLAPEMLDAHQLFFHLFLCGCVKSRDERSIPPSLPSLPMLWRENTDGLRNLLDIINKNP